MPLDVLIEAMCWFHMEAVKHQASDPERTARNLKIAADIGAELLPYCHPKLVKLVSKMGLEKSKPLK